MCYFQLDNNILPYVKALMDVFPKRCMQPRFEYGSSGQDWLLFVFIKSCFISLLYLSVIFLFTKFPHHYNLYWLTSELLLCYFII